MKKTTLCGACIYYCALKCGCYTFLCMYYMSMCMPSQLNSIKKPCIEESQLGQFIFAIPERPDAVKVR